MNEEGHPDVNGSLAAWALDACPPDEASRIAEHVASCTTCSAEADRLHATATLLAVAVQTAPPPALRGSVLAEARRRRAPGVPAGIRIEEFADLARAYATEVEVLDELLASLTPELWGTPLLDYDSVRGLMVHLSHNDATFAADLGLASPTTGMDTRLAWRTQADAVVQGVSGNTALLEREATLAGPRPVLAPARSAIVQRTFETWIHADDIRAVAGRPPVPPPGDSLRQIVGLGTGALPQALHSLGRQRPGQAARLVLTGPGSGEWLIPLAPEGASGIPGSAAAPAVTITAGAEEFCRLVAGRLPVEEFAHRSEGDPAIVSDLLATAATLGCDYRG
ncbi:maleylpyruvate isomerase family mycothiol-dependent enzyme [Actinomadura barringtoniae]|uniref:Maleylpyruvate isomerase family mycothiol-dependent enzyme n=1 Tax=Actinomadura barringtoniae TaxID=1427535 RepID=A0A939PRZ7_9ACTN|nr:maleylpyruvate isomerase family mycothiol-dependent enzyme [Actinomadura barringtoniae]MBO2454024.1 maleylpyruvate isomerase family mycothiol-dependent enzyme [Actinomadura barringtoniae]